MTRATRNFFLRGPTCKSKLALFQFSNTNDLELRLVGALLAAPSCGAFFMGPFFQGGPSFRGLFPPEGSFLWEPFVREVLFISHN